MKRNEFVKSHGATCRNWRAGWSFVNAKEKFIIFGAWSHLHDDNGALILSEEWKITPKGRKNQSYNQSLEHIRLIQEEGYQLETFPMIIADDTPRKERNGPAKIKEIIPKLSSGFLTKVGVGWYAAESDATIPLLPEEVVNPEEYFEGASKKVFVNVYERNSDAKARCLRHYGYKCVACSFDFEEVYGRIGKQYIHVHHLTPLSEIKKEYRLDPIKDLRPVCPNCHAIIHRKQPALSIEQLKQHLSKRE